MTTMIVTGGTVVDGTGAAARVADVAIDGDRVTEIAEPGSIESNGAQVIDATGCYVTPGFVDIHTHLDAQIWWDPVATSSCWHGVTSLVLGNCGVTFAPCRPDDRAYLASVMETVEDIPADAIIDGLPWTWDTYGEYLKSLSERELGPNVGGMVGHSAVRYYVMGARSLDMDPASEQEIAAMQELVDEAMAAGALGFSTSRSVGHRVPDGRNTPGTWASPEEMLALCDVLGRHGKGVIELAPRLGELDAPKLDGTIEELKWMAEATRRTGRPMSFALAQNRPVPTFHAEILRLVSEANAAGALFRPQTTSRGIGLLFGLSNKTPWDHVAAWSVLEGKSLEERLAVLADKATRDDMIAAADATMSFVKMKNLFAVLVGAGDARYAYTPDDSLEALAAAAGETPAATFVRLTLESDGRALFNFPFLNQTMDAIEEMLDHPDVVLGLGDSGAHVSTIMDASWPTFFLSYWVRDRKKLSIEEGIRRMTSEPAELFGIADRGVLRPGAFADLNVFELDAMRLPTPTYAHDFPNGAGRYVQGASGYRSTIVNGVEFMRDGAHTGAMAGAVLRG